MRSEVNGTKLGLLKIRQIHIHTYYADFVSVHLKCSILMLLSDLLQSDHTEVLLTQTGVPKSEMDVTKENWDRYYWDSIKRVFGFGAFFT